MSKFDYPKEITKDNIKQTLDRAISIKKKTEWAVGISVFLFTTLGILIFLGTFYGLIDFLAHSNASSLNGLFALVFGLASISLFLIFIFQELIEKATNKTLKLDYRESVLVSCIIMSNYLFSGERIKAKKELSSFIIAILGLGRTTGRAYSDEITLLSNGRKQLRRMLSFSEEEIPQLLLNFGTNLYNNNDPMAYVSIQKMINETQKYGKPEGTFTRLENQVKSFRGIITLILSIATIIATILAGRILL